jgi:tetratricopeptide (TPR) repeat protein
MTQASLTRIIQKPAAVIAMLTLTAVLGFWGVNRLVVRFGEQRKALARRLYRQSQAQQKDGETDLAVLDLRAALDYDPGNFQYQLSLARLLRDTGRTGEAESYLISLWERDPQSGAVNLAIARLQARQHAVERAIQYYHNAMYGVWDAQGDTRRRDARLELVKFLLQEKAFPQAQAELISWTSVLPADPALQLTVADLFSAAHDDEHALSEYQSVLRRERNNPAALAGAGGAAYRLGQYRTAQGYLAQATRSESSDETTKQLQITNTILGIDPFKHGLSTPERNRRVRLAFIQVGERLRNCAEAKGIDLTANPATDPLASLNQRWTVLKPKMAHLGSYGASDIRDAAMDLAFEIEQQTEQKCGAPTGMDEALLLLSQDATRAER